METANASTRVQLEQAVRRADVAEENACGLASCCPGSCASWSWKASPSTLSSEYVTLSGVEPALIFFWLRGPNFLLW